MILTIQQAANSRSFFCVPGDGATVQVFTFSYLGYLHLLRGGGNITVIMKEVLPGWLGWGVSLLCLGCLDLGSSPTWLGDAAGEGNWFISPLHCCFILSGSYYSREAIDRSLLMLPSCAASNWGRETESRVLTLLLPLSSAAGL